MEANPYQTMSQLGARLAVYQPGTGKVILFSLLLILIGLPCTIVGVRNNTSATVYTNSSNSFETWLISAGVILVLCGVIAIILALGNRKLRVDLYEQGFVAVSKHGAKEIYWQQITHVWHKLEEIHSSMEKDPKTGVSTPKIRKTSLDAYAVQCANGIICEVDTSFYGLSSFGPVLEQTYPRYLFPRMLASYRVGTPLTFGTLTVSSAGIMNTKSDGVAHLVWGSFNALEVDKKKGEITIRRGTEFQPWSSISLTDTPNLAVFEALVNTIAKG